MVSVFLLASGLLKSDINNWCLTRDKFPSEIHSKQTDEVKDFGQGG